MFNYDRKSDRRLAIKPSPIKVKPESCFFCLESKAMSISDGLCSVCRSKICTIKHVCKFCGFKLSCESKVCGLCISKKKPVLYKSIYAPFEYVGVLKKLYVDYKFNRKLYLLPMFVSLLKDSLMSNGIDYGEVDYVTAVPSSWESLSRRGYNQAALLAKYIAYFLGKSSNFRCCVRIESGQSQINLNKKQRLQNVSKSFISYEKFVMGKTILLIDDVITTGATLKYCTQSLLSAGAKDVHVLVLFQSVLD